MGTATDSAPRDGALVRLFLADTARAYRVAFRVVAIVVVAATVALLALGASHQVYMAEDAAALLDGGWRVYQGQRPHTDFVSYLGTVVFLVTAAGMWLSGPTATALAIGYVLLFAPVTFWAWALARPRFPAMLTAVYTLLTGFLLVGTRSLDLDTQYWMTSYAMQYNRLGWALFCLLLPPTLVPPREAPSARRCWLEGVSTGCILALLAFTKLNFFGAAVGIVGLGSVLFGLEWRTAAGTLLGFAAVALGLLAYLRFDAPAMAADWLMIAGVQDPAGRLLSLRFVLERNIPDLLLAAGLTAILWYPRSPARPPFPAGWRSAVAALALLVLGVLICSTNSQFRDIPLFAIAGLVLCEACRRQLVPDDPAPRRTYACACVAAVALACLTLGADMASVVYSVGWKIQHRDDQPPTAHIDAPALRDWPLPLRPGESYTDTTVAASILEGNRGIYLSPYQYAAWVNDGLALARAHVGTESRVLGLDFVNPFPFALGLPSPRGTALCWHNGRLVDDKHHPPAEKVFREVTHVLVPQRSLCVGPDDGTEFLLRVYGPTLKADFEKAGQSRLWTLYRRRTDRRGSE